MQERAEEIENVFKRNSKNNELSIASCLCYSIISLMTNKPKGVNFSFIFFCVEHNSISACVCMFVNAGLNVGYITLLKKV